jgi:uncharacterized protein (AIM24 family)
MITREKVVKPVISGTGTVFMQPSLGEFTILNLQNDKWILDRRTYYVSELDVGIGAFTNRAIGALFSGKRWLHAVVVGTEKVIICSKRWS